jgi:hypothetical protein
MAIRLTVVCLLLAAFALAFGALVNRDPERFVSLNENNRCLFEMPCNSPN